MKFTFLALFMYDENYIYVRIYVWNALVIVQGPMGNIFLIKNDFLNPIYVWIIWDKRALNYKESYANQGRAAGWNIEENTLST